MNELLLLLPHALRNKACVAGGYAADRARAGDVDLWVCAGSDAAWARAQIVKHLEAMNLVQHVRLAHNQREDQGYSTVSHLVATLPHEHAGKHVQILVTTAIGPHELVERFDISTHAIAKYLKGGILQVAFATQWTGLSEPPRVLRTSTPSDTLDRLERICERYGLTLDADEVTRLKALADDEQACADARAWRAA